MLECIGLLLKSSLKVLSGVLLKSMDARLERCRAFLLVPGVLQTVQRAEFWDAILALQAYWPCHLGVDNLNVARTVGRLLDRDCLAKPDLAQYMTRIEVDRRLGSPRSRVMFTDADVEQGRVRLVGSGWECGRLILLQIWVGVINLR